MTSFFSASVTIIGTSEQVVESADFDRSVAVRSESSTGGRVGFSETEAETGFAFTGETLYLVLPAGHELYVYSSGADVSVLVSGSPG